ncbi:MAG: RNase P subunit p30 family protein [Haloarculaceae archaeon]
MLYEAVHARPDGESTVARMALTAAEQGYDGLVIRNHGDAMTDYDADRITEAYGVDVVDGVEIRAGDRSRASGFLGTHRDRRTVVCLHGGGLNRFGVEQDRLDVLAHPMRDGDVNHVLAKAAAENGVRLEFNFAGVLRSDGGPRVQAVEGLRKLRDLVRKYDVPYVVSGDAASHLQLRAPRELVAVGEVVGFEAEEVRAGLREWGRVASRNRERQSDAFVEPGVRRGRLDEPE